MAGKERLLQFDSKLPFLAIDVVICNAEGNPEENKTLKSIVNESKVSFNKLHLNQTFNQRENTV